MASASWVTLTKAEESDSVPKVGVATLVTEKIAPVTLVVAVPLLVMVVLDKSKILPVSVKVCAAVELVRLVDNVPMSPVNDAVALEEVNVPDSNPPEVITLDDVVSPRPVPVESAPVVKEKLVPVASSDVAAISPPERVRSPSVKVMFPVVNVRELVSAPAPAIVIRPVPKNPKVGLVVALPKDRSSVALVLILMKLLFPSEMVNEEASASSISISVKLSKLMLPPSKNRSAN